MKQSPPKSKQDEWQLRQLVQILKRRWRIAATAAVIGALFSVTFHLVCPKKYESKAQLLVMRKDPRLAVRGVESTGDAEARVTEDLLATHMQMLQSRSLVDGALKDDGLTELPSIVEHLSATKKPCDYVIGNMTISRGGSGQARSAHVLNVAFRSGSQTDSELVLRAIVKKYQSFLSVTFQDVNKEAASLINQAQRELGADLEEAERKYEQFRQASSNLMWKAGSETTNVHRVRYEGILQEIATLQLTRAEAAARLDAVTDRLDGRDANELTDLERLSLVDEKNLTRIGLLLMAQRGETESPDFQSEQPIRLAHARTEFDTYSTLQLKERALMTDLGAQHPEVINVRKQIQSLQEFMGRQKEELKSGRSNFSLNPKALFEAFHQLLKNDIRAMDRREERLAALSKESVELASEMVTDEIQGETLRREVTRKQALFDAAVDRLRDINLTKDYGGFINEVLSEPEAGVKVSPRLSISLALGILLSMAICALGIGVAEYRDRRFRSIDDMENLLHAPVMGRIPLVGNPVSKTGSIFASKSADDPKRTPRLLDSDSRGADAFRLLRTSQVFSDGEERRQVLCVTSPNPADGKSTMTGNLSISLAQLGRRVLIIDCDLRRPSQHELFSLSNERGLTTILKGEGEPSDLIQATFQKNLWLLTRGESVPNPAEFLATGEFARLLDSLREKFDHIFLDSPPVLPVADALSTAAIADGVIVVIRVEQTTQLQAQAACSSLKHAGADLEGVVVNGLKPGSLTEEGYGYGYGYSYDYKYSGYSEYATSNNGSDESTKSETESNKSRLSTSFERNGNTNGSLH